jgi:[acyl-carrier-protein] S-malonyltransferase
VIAGDAAAVARAIDACKAAGAKKAMALAMSVPSHCSLLRRAVEPLREALDGVVLAEPAFPVVHNVDASVGDDLAGIRSRLLDQLYMPVRWVDCVLAMKAAGARRLLECGPGRVLSGLARRIDRELPAAPIGTVDAFDSALPA